MNNFLEQCLDAADGVTGVLHIGAHEGQEAELYFRHRIDRVTWIEANPDLETRLRSNVEKYGHRVIIDAVSSRGDPATRFYVASNDGESSSLLPMLAHKEIWPDVTQCETKIIPSTTIDSLHRQHGLSGHNFWVLDIQGMEAFALRGASFAISHVDYVVCEFTGCLYQNGSTIEEIDELLPDFSAASGWRNQTGEFGEMFYRRVRRSGRDLLRCVP